MVRGTDSQGKPSQIDARPLFAIVGAIILWVVVCSAAWWFWARPDHANLAIARTCYG